MKLGATVPGSSAGNVKVAWLEASVLPFQKREVCIVRNEFTAIIENDGEWFIAYCPEIPGANGQGKTKEEAKTSLVEAIELILEDRREDGLRGVPEDAVREVVSLG